MAEKRKSASNRSILDFFSKKAKSNESDGSNFMSETFQSKTTSSTTTATKVGELGKPEQTLSLEKNNECPVATDRKYDIINFVDKNIDDLVKMDFLENVWTPEPLFEFPYTTSNNKRRKFRFHWLQQFRWLSYSPTVDGAFCKFCVLFAPKEAGVNSQQLGFFVKKPYHNWKKALDVFRDHEKKEYHIKAVCRSKEFIEVMKGDQVAVNVLLDSEKQKQIQVNRQRLIPIIEAVILCGRQELPLRGHRDSGPVNIELSDQSTNTGNFKAILGYRARGDEDLKQMLTGAGQRNKYISPGIQNDIVEACSKAIIDDVTQRVNKAKAFSILADETADISGIEQLSIGVKYYDSEKNINREDFLKFVPVVELTGSALATTIITELKTLGLDMQYLRGQGYDGASSMSGHLNGVQAIIGETYKLAPYVHCMGHVFNLVVTDACGIPAIRNALGTVQEIRNFFVPPKRRAILNEHIEQLDAKAQGLKRLCQTRWIERFHAVEDFIELFAPVVDSLTVISGWSDKAVSREASAFIHSLTSGEFLVAIIVVQHLFAYGLPLSKTLQQKNVDLMAALNHATNLVTVLENMRSDAKQEFEKLFQIAVNLANEHEVEIRQPRLTGKQRHRANPEVNNPQEFYRIILFIPFLDSFLTALKERFVSHRSLLDGFSILVPSSIEKLDKWTHSLEGLIEYYKTDEILEGKSNIEAEFHLWHQTLKSELENSQSSLPSNALDALPKCDKMMFPNIHRLLQLLATLPVSTASSERSFSTLKRLKTYLRNTIGQNRLNGLAVLSVHREQKINMETVLGHLARQKNRRILLI